MSKMIISILILALMPYWAAGQGLVNMVRAAGGSVPEAGAGAPITLADYKTVPNPEYAEPGLRKPPHLTDDHVKRLIELMVDAELSKRPGISAKELSLTKEQAQRIVTNLVVIDSKYVDAIPGPVWNRAIEDMGKVAAKEFEFRNGKGNWEETVNAMINAAANKILDPFSVYWSKEEFKRFQDEMNNSFVDVGMILKDDGRIDIVIPRSPAEKAGLKAGDKIVAVDGQPVSNRQQIQKKTLGQAGTSVRLTVTRDGRRMEFAAVRAEINTRNVFSKKLGDVGYVYLGQFSPNCDDELIAAVADLQAKGARKLIIDVRGNLGGTVDSVSQIASEFFKDGQKIVSFKRQGQVMSENVTDGDGRFFNMKVAILVNGGSASASEILAGAMQDVRGPVIVGSRSYGKGTMQDILPDRQGRALKLTMGRWYTPRDRSIDAKHDAQGEKIKDTGGVIPDHLVVLGEEQEAAIMRQIYREVQGASPEGRKVEDPVFNKALELLGR
ncbi:MAG: S41 family peptidase [Elusimicrobia bacterium]|nr:S41 family peptidase [Elusimicrobiota bacterium]